MQLRSIINLAAIIAIIIGVAIIHSKCSTEANYLEN